MKVEAARADRSVRQIVDEALAAWVEPFEEAEDAAAAVEALAEYQRDGTRHARRGAGASAVPRPA